MGESILVTQSTVRMVGMVMGVSALIAAATLVWDRVVTNPEVCLVLSHEGVDWVKMPEATSLRVRALGDYQTSFRLGFHHELDSDSEDREAWLQLRAMTDARVYVNHEEVLTRHGDPATWKSPRTIDIGFMLREGANEIRVEVYHRNGPRLLWARCAALGLDTNAGWEVSNDSQTWVGAVPARDIIPSELSGKFSSPASAFIRTLPWAGIAFVIVMIVSTLYARSRLGARATWLFAAGRLRYWLMAAWAILALNNIMKIDAMTGFDIEGHINYIHFITYHGRLPLAHEGWQTFQSPLYYILSAGPYWLLSKVADLETVIKVLRAIPLACGLMQIEIAYRIGRRVFPKRADLHIVTAVVAGFLPANIYIAQYIGNEPLAGFLSALVCLQLVRMIQERPMAGIDDRVAVRLAPYAMLGCTLGLAILAKVTAVLLIPAAGIVIVYREGRMPTTRSIGIARSLGVFAATASLVAGWYFIRNWMHYGIAFVGGWESAREIIWWQDPGYRTVTQFVSFGEALVRPISAGTAGLWDAFYSTLWLDGLLSSMVDYDYRPPWNYDFVLAGAWWGLVLSVLLLAGMARAVFLNDSTRRTIVLCALGCVAIYFAAFSYLYLTLPIYSTGKATYTVGLASFYGVFVALGLEYCARGRIGRAAGHGLIAAWAVVVYAGYFVL